MAVERTLSIIKPDATRRNLTGKINAKLEAAGYRVFYTRDGDYDPNPCEKDSNGDGEINLRDVVQTRIDLINASGADIQLSLHINDWESDDEELLRATIHASLQTHTDPRSIGSAVAVACLVGYLATRPVTSLEAEHAALQAAISCVRQAESVLAGEYGISMDGENPHPPRFSGALAILAVLARHSAAYEKEDVNEILATWPGYPAGSLNALRKAFQTRGTTVRMTLRPLGEPDVLGDRATVQCEQVREAVMGGARRNPDSRRVKVTLGRRGVGWVIEQVE